MLRSINSPKHRISKKRRDLIKIIGLVCVGGMMVVLYKIKGFYMIKRLYYKLINKIQGPVTAPPQEGRIIAELSESGESISVEKAMNSRCSSDYDGNQQRNHWGLFDRGKKLSKEQIYNVIEKAKIVRFTDRRVEIKAKENMLTFIMDNHASGTVREWMMIESGMQQQAVGLVCSALGVGMKFRNLGVGGKPISEDDHANIRIRLDAMKPSHEGLYWTDATPFGRQPYKGNLPEPARDGGKPLITALEGLKAEKKGSTAVSEKTVSQLLWAALGKVPHLYESKPWGMTIPTWKGRQDITAIYCLAINSLSRYQNWEKTRPAHNLVEINSLDAKTGEEIFSAFGASNRIFVVGKNEATGRALWETGYQLHNMIVQADSLGISYKATLIEEKEKLLLRNAGIEDPVAVIVI